MRLITDEPLSGRHVEKFLRAACSRRFSLADGPFQPGTQAIGPAHRFDMPEFRDLHDQDDRRDYSLTLASCRPNIELTLSCSLMASTGAVAYPPFVPAYVCAAEGEIP